MKKLSAIDLDLMEKELPVLEEPSLDCIKGGIGAEPWACFFNCMEYVGKQYGFNADYSFYANSYGGDYGYHPSTSAGLDSTKASEFFSKYYGGYSNYTSNLTNDSFNHEQIMMYQPPENAQGNYHSVIPIGVENGKIKFYDPTLAAYGEDPYGYADPSEVIGIFGPPSDGSGVIPSFRAALSGSLSGIYDGISGSYDPNGGYYA